MKTAVAPARVDLRLDAEFEELQADVKSALSSVNAAAADWEKMVRLATNILETKSKDLLVAAYLSIGLVYTRKLDGFTLGCNTYLDVMENFWETAFPEGTTPGARAKAIGWWVERSAAALRGFKDLPFPKETAEQLLVRCRKADAFLSKKLDDAPTLKALSEWLECATQAPAPLPARVTTAAARAENAAVANPSEISTDADVKDAFARIETEARRLSAYLQPKSAADPRVYRLNRLAYWLTVDDAPPAEDGRTPIAGPEEALVERFETLIKERRWPALLQFAEDTAFQSIFWLDLQHASAQALEKMGDDFTRATQTVACETAAFVARWAGLERLQFSDGKPFANDETRAWLQSITGSSDASFLATPISLSELENSIRSDIERIKPLVKSRKYPEAARAFQDRLKASASAREQFLCRLEFAGLFSKTGGAPWFAPQAEQILEDIDAYRLDQFDPALALRGITLALKGYRAQSDAVSKKRTEELLHRIAQIDLTEFVRQGGAN